MSKKYFGKIIFAIMLMAVILPAVVRAQVQTEYQSYSNQILSREELTQMLAPIALYPDVLLSQILIAASYPFEVAEAERWLAKNQHLKGDVLDDALKTKNWDVSVLSLCHYPKILTMMTENLNWTAKLGDAFISQQQDVMDIVQELRARAYDQGNLTTTREQKVIVEERLIYIEPVASNYIYVPVYDSLVIYGHWWLPAFLPFPIFYPGVVAAGPRMYYSPRVYVGVGVFGWSNFNWREHHVRIVDIDRTKRFNRHVNIYRDAPRPYWRPDYDRRMVRERRAREIPRFDQPVRPTVPPGRRGGEMLPLPKEPVREKRPTIDRDRYEQRERNKFDVPAPKKIEPSSERPGLIQRDDVERRKGGTVNIIEPGKVAVPQTERKPVIGIDKVEKPNRGTGEVGGSKKDRPIFERKESVETDKVGKRDRGDDDRFNPGEGKDNRLKQGNEGRDGNRPESHGGGERGVGGGRRWDGK
jgi:hypothetical protein